jgi:hypothetical protein
MAGYRRPHINRARPWTRFGAASMGAHVFYELACGVAMPLCSVAGPAPAVVGWATGTTGSITAAGRAPDKHNAAFGVLNGIFLSAVVAHIIYWPKRWSFGVPWLTECEGLRGNAIGPYNLILYTSGAAAIAGLVENGPSALRRGVVVPLILVPVLLRVQDVEFTRLKEQARERPAWWNRRLHH